MNFVNRTPFAAQAYSALDKSDRESRVVVTRVGYELRRVREAEYEAVVLDDSPVELVMEDRYRGDKVGAASVIQESDLAPYKPKCDVLFVGKSYTPSGLPEARWGSRLQVQARTDKHASGAKLIDKTIAVCGPREFRRRLLVWTLSEPGLATSVELCWEHAFGGTSFVPHPAAGLVDEPPPPLLNEVCFSNPVGCGWIERRYAPAYERANGETLNVLSAPQIESVREPTRGLIVAKHPTRELGVPEMVEVAARYGARPVGLGVVGRAWSARAPLAGTYDEEWLEHRHPYLPSDFDMRYWNCAPEDQQIDFPAEDFRVELTNLLPDAVPHGGHAGFTMPGHRAFMLVVLEAGGVLPMPMVIDTIEIHGEEMRVDVVWRGAVLDELAPCVAELRFEVDPTQPLIKRAPAEVDGGFDG